MLRCPIPTGCGYNFETESGYTMHLHLRACHGYTLEDVDVWYAAEMEREGYIPWERDDPPCIKGAGWVQVISERKTSWALGRESGFSQFFPERTEGRVKPKPEAVIGAIQDALKRLEEGFEKESAFLKSALSKLEEVIQ